MLPAPAEEDLGIDLEQPAEEEEDPDIESAVLCGRSQISIENAARYHSDHLSDVKKNPPNFEFESCRTITENSARMDRATTKQEGGKRRQECKTHDDHPYEVMICAINMNENYKIRICKRIM